MSMASRNKSHSATRCSSTKSLESNPNLQVERRFVILRFDTKVPVDIEVNTIILRFDIAVEGLPIIAIRPEIAVSRKKKEKKTISGVSVIARAVRSLRMQRKTDGMYLVA